MLEHLDITEPLQNQQYAHTHHTPFTEGNGEEMGRGEAVSSDELVCATCSDVHASAFGVGERSDQRREVAAGLRR